MVEITGTLMKRWCRWLWLPVSGLLFGIIVGPLIAWRWDVYVESIRPEQPVITEVVVLPRDEYGSVKIEVRFRSSPTKACDRFGMHQFSRGPVKPEDGERRFIFAGGSIAGLGYPARALRAFTIAFNFPSTMSPDTYLYEYRTFYICDPLGLVMFRDHVEREITIP